MIELIGAAILDLPPFDALLDLCAREEGVTLSLHVAIMTADEGEIRRINRKTRDIDRATDVLSFPTIAYKSGTLKDNIPRLRREFDPDIAAYRLGDIIICPSVALRQAREYGHSPRREFAYLFVHGVMHLFGYDHQTDDQRAHMRNIEENILRAANIAREEEAL